MMAVIKPPAKAIGSPQTFGFTLLEVVITIGLLMTITMAVANMMKGSFDVRDAIGENGIVDHRMAVVMQKLNEDLMHAFLIPTVDQNRMGNRKRGTIFYIKSSQSDELRFTTYNRRSVVKNMRSSDQTYVVYKVEADRQNPAWSHLYRGETTIIPERLEEIENMQKIGSYIKSLKVQAWNGNDWNKFNWNSASGEFKDKLPQMVKIRLEAWIADPKDLEEEKDSDSAPTVSIQTIVALPHAFNYPQVKDSMRYYKYQYE